MANFICAKCNQPISEENAVECPFCWEIYHKECWEDTENCVNCKKYNPIYEMAQAQKEYEALNQPNEENELKDKENTVDEELIVVSEADSYDEEVLVLPEENTYGEDENANEDDDDLPGVFDLYDEPVTVAAKAADQAKPILNEVMAADCAWRKDMPGSPVRDIRSAISLNDRVIFINLLFKEDAQAFVDTLAKINTMETLDQAVEYICETFPTWDLNSDLVYRFMMAVRRKVK